MKSLTTFLYEAKINHKKFKAALPDAMQDWYDVAKNFATAGAWNLTDPKLTPGDMVKFMDEMWKYDFTKIKGLNRRAQKAAENINNLIAVFAQENADAVLEAFEEYAKSVSGEYWFQTDLDRNTPGGYIAEAALLLTAYDYIYGDGGKNYWATGDWTLDKMRSELKKKQ